MQNESLSDYCMAHTRNLSLWLSFFIGLFSFLPPNLVFLHRTYRVQVLTENIMVQETTQGFMTMETKEIPLKIPAAPVMEVLVLVQNNAEAKNPS